MPSRPLTLRLPEPTEQLVAEEMRRSGRTRTAVVVELVNEAARMRRFPGVAFRGPVPRRAWLMGSGLDVWELVAIVRDYGERASQVPADYEAVTPGMIRLALAYADCFPDEIQSLIEQNRRPKDELLARYPFLEDVSR